MRLKMKLLYFLRRLRQLQCLRHPSITKKSRIMRRRDRDELITEPTEVGILRKRKGVDSNNHRVRKKPRVSGKFRGVVRNGEIDRISELPEAIIHHIFSFLHSTKDLVRISLMSSNWKSMFNSYNSFDFDEKWFRESRVGRDRWAGRRDFNRDAQRQRNRFRTYVDKAIATRLEPLDSIHKFRLSVENNHLLMEKWILSALEKKVKQLELDIHAREGFKFPLLLWNEPSIISLKLSRTVFLPHTNMKLANLRQLSITDSCIHHLSMMKNVEESCRLLEDLRLVRCDLEHLSISSLVKLRRLEVKDCLLESIDIPSSIHLESFWYHAKGFWYPAKEPRLCRFNLGCTENLKFLTMKDKKMSDSSLEGWIHRCPLLEKLVLHECNRLKKIKIRGEKLKSLVFVNCFNLYKVSIDAPKLLSLEYSGWTMPFRSMNVPCLNQVKVSSAYKCNVLPLCEWNSWFQGIYGDFDGCNGLKLIKYADRNMSIFEDPREVLQDDDSFRTLELTASSTSVLKSVDNWLEECYGKSLQLTSCNEELATLISGMIMKREENLSCCGYYSNKCWRHFIADVKVSTLDLKNETLYHFTWSWRSRKT